MNLLKYHNIEGLKLPTSEEIFFQPSNYNEYTGFNKYPIYAWWSIERGLVWNMQCPDDIFGFERFKWFRNELEEDLKEHFNIDLIESELVLIDNQKYSDVEFLIRFDWDDGDRSVGIWPGYVVSLVLNNDKPVYRTIDLYDCERTD